MHELRLITIFGSRVRRFANDFHEWQSHEWKSLENRFTSDPKIVIHSNECIILFLTRYFTSWTHNSAKTIIVRWFAIVAKDGLFWLNILTSPQLYLWCHTNVRYWHCDVTFVDCSCTRKLTQRRSSLVNNNREYRFLTTRYSRLSVWKKGFLIAWVVISKSIIRFWWILYTLT